VTSLDTNTRLLDALHELHRLELQVEQYRIHISELSAHATEADRATIVLEKLKAGLATQRKYCDLLSAAADLTVKNEPRVA
jgi:hypothetical protein